MALYLKIFVRPYSIIVPNFKFLSQSARFPQILTDSSPAISYNLLCNTGRLVLFLQFTVQYWMTDTVLAIYCAILDD